jgi:hypothetical protein
MSNVIVTASSAALVRACGYSFRADVEVPPSAPTGEQMRGTRFGLLVEHRINVSSVGPSLDRIGEGLSPEESARLGRMWKHALVWLEANMRAGWVAERAFAYDPSADAARELPRLEHRDYSACTPDETVAGTADIVAIDGDVVVIYDWKSTVDGAPEVDATAQLEWLALFAARAWGYDAARIVTLKVTEDGVFPSEPIELDLFALAAIAERIAADVAAIPSAEPVPGDWCKGRYCKAISVCPETSRAMAPALVPATALLKRYPFTTAIESPDHLQALMQMRAMVDAASEAVKEAIKSYVGDREIQCSDGTVIKATFKTMPRESRAELLEAFKLLGGTQEQLDACWHPRVESAGIKAMKPRKGRAA